MLSSCLVSSSPAELIVAPFSLSFSMNQREETRRSIDPSGGMDPDNLRASLRTTSADLWSLIDTAIALSTADCGRELKARKDSIVERLSSSTEGFHGGMTVGRSNSGATGQLLRLRLLQGLKQLIYSTDCSLTAAMDASNLIASANNNQQVNDQGDGAGLSLPSEESIGASFMNSGDSHIPILSLVSSSPAKSSVPFTSSAVSPSFKP